MSKYKITDTFLVSGWLFADLLLGVALIFLISLPGKQTPPVPIIKWTVAPTSLDVNNPECKGGPTAPSCTVVLSETADSEESLDWQASSDMSTTVGFSTTSGVLSPGQSVKITISAFPCHNGSFTFRSSRNIMPLTVAWRCTLPQERLNFEYKRFNLAIKDVNGLLANSPAAINDIEQQVRKQPFLQQASVGLSIVYGGTPDTAGIGQAQAVARRIYEILDRLGKQGFAFQRSSYYVPLFNLDRPTTEVQVDVYLFQTK